MGIQARKARERAQRIKSIHDAALQVFVREGLRAATMDEIASQAQLAKGTVYYYFESKEMLIESLMSELAQEYFQGLLDGAADQETPTAIAQNMVRGLLAQYARRPAPFHVIHMVLGEPEPRHKRALKAFVEAHLNWLEQLETKVTKTLRSHRVPVQAFISLMGTYAHGILFEVVSGRPVKQLLMEALETFAVLFAPRPAKTAHEASKLEKEE